MGPVAIWLHRAKHNGLDWRGEAWVWVSREEWGGVDCLWMNGANWMRAVWLGVFADGVNWTAGVGEAKWVGRWGFALVGFGWLHIYIYINCIVLSCSVDPDHTWRACDSLLSRELLVAWRTLRTRWFCSTAVPLRHHSEILLDKIVKLWVKKAGVSRHFFDFWRFSRI